MLSRRYQAPQAKQAKVFWFFFSKKNCFFYKLRNERPIMIGNVFVGNASISLIIAVHVIAGSLALLSGAAAVYARKGGRAHRLAGTVFFISMLIMSALGASVASLRSQQGSVIMGVFTFYLVATGWTTVRRRQGSVGWLEVASLGIALGDIGLAVAFGLQAANTPTGMLNDTGPKVYYAFAAFVSCAAALDLRVLLRGGISGVPRLARHVWRICTALWIATGSFFLGQQKVMPAFLHGAPVLFVPEIAVLGVMIFWLVRIRSFSLSKRMVIAS